MFQDILFEVSFPSLITFLFITLITLFFIYKSLFSSKSSSSRSILLTGPSLSGKTSLFYRLSESSFVETVSSLTPNTSSLFLSGSQLQLLDYPGHPRLRPELLRLISRSPPRVLILVIDGSDKSRVKEASELLFDFFALENFRSPIILAISKSDISNFRSAGVVAAEIEREIDAIRHSRQADGIYIGIQGESFKLAKHSPVPVRLCAFSSTAADGCKALLAALSKSLLAY